MHLMLMVLAAALSLWHAYDLYRRALVTSFLLGLLAVYGVSFLFSYPQLVQRYELMLIESATHVYFFGSLVLNLLILLLFKLAAPRCNSLVKSGRGAMSIACMIICARPHWHCWRAWRCFSSFGMI